MVAVCYNEIRKGVGAVKLLFKQRFFTFTDNFDIYDERGKKAYVVEGQLTFGHCFKIYDSQNREVATVRQKLFRFLPKFELYLGQQHIGSIQKEFTLLKPNYQIDYNGWHIMGDWLQWDYTIVDGSGREVAKISKELLNLTDTYSIHVHNPGDALCALMVVLAIDAEKCSRRD